MSIEIKTVRGRRDLTRFIDLPHDLYWDDPCYVPQLALQQRGLLGPKSSFRQHADMELFLARRNGRTVGRVVAIHNRLHNGHSAPSRGSFGFFDSEENTDTAHALLDACRRWLKARGLEGMLGPLNPDLNNSCGVLVEGFDRRPGVFMPYNAPYYPRLLEECDLGVVKRLNAWEIESRSVPPDALQRAKRAEVRLKQRGYVLRPMDLKNFTQEMAGLRSVYNDALEGTWGHTPLTEEEFAEQAVWLRRICPSEFIQVVEYEGEIVGFIGAAPDLNQCLCHVPRGRLLPLGWARLLLGWRRVRWGRIVMYGVHRKHRGRGLAAWLYTGLMRVLRSHGYAGAEASYVLADNQVVNDLSEKLGGILTKRYAIYDRIEEGIHGHATPR